ncbi:MAG: Uma2 family endonuclease [Microcystaceae cyanobacterium]
MYQTNPPANPKDVLPTMYDLPSEDPKESGLPDEFHEFQPQLLRETCQVPNYYPNSLFVGTDLNLYYDLRHPLWYKRPDWFLVLGVTPAQQQEALRLSYVVWQEGVNPFLVIELLSPGTEAEDLGQTIREINQPPTKWQVYEQILRIPYYIVFDRYENQLRAFRLVGTHYEPLTISDERFWLEDIQLGLGVWQGCYQGIEGLWLRWYDSLDNWITIADERVELERRRAEQEHQRAEQEKRRAEQAEEEIARLRALLEAKDS